MTNFPIQDFLPVLFVAIAFCSCATKNPVPEKQKPYTRLTVYKSVNGGDTIIEFTARYDTMGRALEEVFYDEDSLVDKRITYEYDSAGNQIFQRTLYFKSYKRDTLQCIEKHEYDGMGKKVKTVLNYGLSNDSVYIFYYYNKDGLLERSMEKGFFGDQVFYSYDDRSRPVRIAHKRLTANASFVIVGESECLAVDTVIYTDSSKIMFSAMYDDGSRHSWYFRGSKLVREESDFSTPLTYSSATLRYYYGDRDSLKIVKEFSWKSGCDGRAEYRTLHFYHYSAD